MKRAARGSTSTIVSANALTSGAVVFRTAEGTWSRDVNAAFVTADSEVAAALLAQSEQDVAADIIVEPYLVGVDATEGGVRPLLMRERIRALGGPTIVENRTLPDVTAA